MASWVVLGVPTSAGTHHAGMEQTPRRLREEGLVDWLRAMGPVTDAGDLPLTPYRPRGIGCSYRDGDRVARINHRLAARVADLISTGDCLLVLGGDCTITLGAVAGLLPRWPDLRVVYFDGDVDLSTPADTESGILDTMVSAHLLGLADTPLSRIGPRFPLLAAEDILYFGYHPQELSPAEEGWLRSHPVRHWPVTRILNDPAAAARRAAAVMGDRSVLVHFDVDVIDSGDAPLGNYPHFHGGLSLDQAVTCLREFVQGCAVVGVVITELNPHHDDDGQLLPRFVDRLVGALREARPVNGAGRQGSFDGA
ncbi:MAG: arginase family protein [Thermaerobacter sp.]|nr:arginase family protein [Thermaerobacter sp.]